MSNLASLIQRDLGWKFETNSSEFLDSNWFLEGHTEIQCTDCTGMYAVYRNQSFKTPTHEDGWAIVCSKCKDVFEIDEFELKTQSEFATWSLRQGTLQKWHKKQSKSTVFQATDEQAVAMRAALDDVNVVVEALAGTGKTTTMKLIAERKNNKRGQYIAFNKSIVEDVKRKIPDSTKANTAHSLAYRAVGHEYRERLNGARLRHPAIAERFAIEQIQFKMNNDIYRYTPVQVAHLVKSTVDNFVQSSASQIGSEHVIPKLEAFIQDDRLKKSIVEHVLGYAQTMWKSIENRDSDLPIEHQHYLKLWHLEDPRINADFILFDEAQDADPVMLDIVHRQTNAQLIYCGDRFQQIYEWRGAVSALASVKVMDRTWLTQSFRFGQDIADWGNEILERLNAPHIVLGNPNQKSTVKPLTNPEVVLCRTNAGMIQNVISFQEQKKKVAICANEAEFIYFFEGCKDLQENGRSRHPELSAFNSWEELLEWVQLHKAEAGSIAPLVTLVKTHGPTKLIATVKSCVPEKDAQVTVSTVHRAKGREWNTVQIYSDFPHIDDMEDDDLRLMYVALTRGREALDVTPWQTVSPGSNKFKLVNSFADLGPIPRLITQKTNTNTTKKNSTKRSRS